MMDCKCCRFTGNDSQVAYTIFCPLLETVFQNLVSSSTTAVSECLLRKINASSINPKEKHRASHSCLQLT